MGKRKGWANLKASYRKDLERGGITQSKYEAGASLAAARRHARTPEHPIKPGKPVAKKYERWYNTRYNQPIKMLTDGGEVFLLSLSPRHRSLIGSHWNAVHSALWNLPMRKAWWWSDSYEARLARFSRFRIKGIPFTSAGVQLGVPEVFHFMTNFDDVENWTYEDTASFNNIYQMVA